MSNCPDCGGCPNCEAQDDQLCDICGGFIERGVCEDCGEEPSGHPPAPDHGQLYNDHGWDADLQFADPGGNSALRAATASNPRNLPCPECGAANRLTPADRARGYCCDACADQRERGW